MNNGGARVTAHREIIRLNITNDDAT
jgi:hypothetical protein